jgi:hypothetical protein
LRAVVDAGIFLGADASDLSDTYIRGDVFNWDQGLMRLALGTVMSGSRSGDERRFERNQNQYLVEEADASSAASIRALVVLARSLLSDVDLMKRSELSLGKWCEFFSAVLGSYFPLYTNQTRF